MVSFSELMDRSDFVVCLLQVNPVSEDPPALFRKLSDFSVIPLLSRRLEKGNLRQSLMAQRPPISLTCCRQRDPVAKVNRSDDLAIGSVSTSAQTR